MFEHRDQLNNTVYLKEIPKRIVSVVPSQSELLWDLGLRSELVGITKFCIHPDEMFRTVERVGGTKTLDLEKIRALKPDLIIGNKEENERDQVLQLQQEFNVWMSDIYTVDDALNMMRQLGVVVGKEEAAQRMTEDVQRSLSRIRDSFSEQRVAYFIWNDPYYGAARHTFIDHVLNFLGFKNALSDLERYPELTVELLHKTDPELCFLSSEPFPFKEKHVKELQNILPDSKIMIVDGEVFSWYGPRLRQLEGYTGELKRRLSL